MPIVPLYSGPVKMLVTPPCGASSNIALMRAIIKPPVELVVDDLENLRRLIESCILLEKTAVIDLP